jgi:hypothetical protein
MDKWFLQDLEDDDRLRWFHGKPRDIQFEEFAKASQKRAKRLAGYDIYTADPFMAAYQNLGRELKRNFNLRNNCAAWALGNTYGERMILPGGKILCPQIGDSLGVPFVYLDGKPNTVFEHLARTRRLAQLDGLEPVKVRADDALPAQRDDQRLIAIALFRERDGKSDTHCVVRAPGSAYFSHKLGIELPPSLLDQHGQLIADPRRAQFGEQLSRWMFFTAPVAGVSHNPSTDIREQVRTLFTTAATPQERSAIMTALTDKIATRSPRMAQHLLKNEG